MSEEMHSCSYYCDRPACIKAQRDELVRKYVELQSEWPSDEDAGEVLRKFEGTVNDGGIDYLCRRDCMFVALQSVRPPVGVVSDDYKEIARLIGSIFFFGDFKAETYNERELEKLLRKTGNFYDTQEQFDDASRQAPTKD